MKKKYYLIIGIILILTIYLLWYYQCYWTACWTSPPPVKTNACQMLHSSGCSASTETITINNFDANKDGKMDSSDNLFELCKNYYGITTEASCKELCDCSFCSQDNSLLCEKSCNSDNDCELSCGCGCISKSEECKYTGIVCEAPGPYEECKCVNNECKYFNLPSP